MNALAPQGIVEQINTITIQSLTKRQELAKKKEELQNLELYQEIEDLESELSSLSKQDSELRETGKQLLLEKGIKKFEALDGTTIQLNKKPWALVIEDESKIPDHYKKAKTTISIDKATLKKDITSGEITIDGVSISEDYTLVINQK